ncbi:MAG: hypothetical protein ACI8XO_002664 [Verrucomicrobiales bacterium]|jgi:hypothetical protein
MITCVDGGGAGLPELTLTWIYTVRPRSVRKFDYTGIL